MSRLSICFRSAALGALISSCALAVDGVILIDQNRALAGNVTPGDAPGFPVSITQPGSYRLSGNLLVGTTNVAAIQIMASDVTLDLNGFGVTCALSASSTFCIGVSGAGFTDIAIRNGRVTALSSATGFAFPVAIDLTTSTANMVTDLRIRQDGLGGGLFIGAGSVLRGNVFSGTGGGPGVVCPTLIEGNVNTAGGFSSAGNGCLKVNNAGFFGF